MLVIPDERALSFYFSPIFFLFLPHFFSFSGDLLFFFPRMTSYRVVRTRLKSRSFPSGDYRRSFCSHVSRPSLLLTPKSFSTFSEWRRACLPASIPFSLTIFLSMRPSRPQAFFASGGFRLLYAMQSQGEPPLTPGPFFFARVFFFSPIPLF